MPNKILMPALSPTMEKGKIVKWYVGVGDRVAAGDVIVDIETDKAVMEVEAVDEGKIEEILVTEGTDNVQVNTPIAILLQDNETIDETALKEKEPKEQQKWAKDGAAEKFKEEEAQTQNIATPTDPAAIDPSSMQNKQGPIVENGFPPPTPLARRLAQEGTIDLKSQKGSGAHGRMTREDVENLIAHALEMHQQATADTQGITEDMSSASAISDPVPSPASAISDPVPSPASAISDSVASSASAASQTSQILSSSSCPQRLFASPLARRLAKENAISLSLLSGSGPNGRIIKRDVLAYENASEMTRMDKKEEKKQEREQEKEEEKKTQPTNDIRQFFDPESYTFVPHDGMRRIIAERLTLSKQTIPHYYLNSQCILERLMSLREQINTAAFAEHGEAYRKISVNDFIIKALAHALQEVPEANVVWSDEGLLRLKHSDVGVAVAVEGGLFTPIIRHASHKPLYLIATEMKDFAKRARARRLRPEEYQGGSTSVSNLGMFGIHSFAAVINPPQSTILAVGKGAPRPVVDSKGEIVAKFVMDVTLSCDHRSIDGAVGARLLEAFRDFIEIPDDLIKEDEKL